MGRIEKTVFISYRRTNFYTALAIYQDLTQHGYDVFFDYQSIDSGDFEKVIIENVKAKAHFLVVLSPSALERCKEPGDWLRLEIETAMEENRNIIPLMMEGFDFGSPGVIQALSGKLATLNHYNGLRLYADYFFDAMEKLRNRFLKVEVEGAHLHPLSNETKEITETNRTTANEAAPVETTQLTAEEWFERGYVFAIEAKNFNEAVRCFYESIRLDPNSAHAYNNLANALSALERTDEAEVAYRKAIELYEASPSGDNPLIATAYYNLGTLLDELERVVEAEAAYRKAIELNPSFGKAYSNLGSLLEDLKRYEEAEAAYHKAIELCETYPIIYFYNPPLPEAYSNLGVFLQNLKRADEAEAAYHKAIELNPSYVTAYNNLVILLRQTNQVEDAMSLLDKWIEISPEDFNPYLGFASVNKQLGKSISKEHTEKVRQLMPEDDWYNRACLESVCDNFDKAFEYLEKAAKTKKFDPVWAWNDPDLQWIRNDPRFIKIVGPKPE